MTTFDFFGEDGLSVYRPVLSRYEHCETIERLVHDLERGTDDDDAASRDGIGGAIEDNAMQYNR